MLPAIAGLTACDESMEVPEAKGSLQLASLGVEVSNAENVINSRAVTDVSAYLVDICPAGESTPVQSYVYGSMPGVVTLAPGDYVVNVRSHELQKAEWERPYFTGTSEQITIVADKITEPTPVKCTFASLKVSIVFGEKLREKMADDVQVTVVANDEGKLVYKPNENNGAGYFATIEGSATLVATFSGTVNGHLEQFSKTYTDVAAGQHRKITFECGADVPVPDLPSGSINPGEGIDIDITYVDEDLTANVDPGKEETIDPGEKPGTLPDLPSEGGDEPGPDQPENPDQPEKPAFGFQGSTLENGKTYLNTEFSEANPAKIIITCPEGIAKAEVIIDSTFLTPGELESVGLLSEFDLCNPVGTKSNGEEVNLSEALAGFGFPVNGEILNKPSSEIEISSFMDLLGLGGTNSSTFTFTITDNTGAVQVNQFTIKVQ